MNSLKGRLLILSTIVLFVFSLFVGLGLERAFQNSARKAEEEKLKGLVFALLGATEVAENGSVAVEESELVDKRLLTPESGLSAMVFNHEGKVSWQSPSLADSVLMQVPSVGVGKWFFRQNRKKEGTGNFELSYGISWAVGEKTSWDFTVLVSEDPKSFQAQLATFRRTLWGWLLAGIGLLITLEIVVLFWGLSPLNKVAEEIREVEEGGASQISGKYPKELHPLTDGLNSLLRHERAQQTRYRNALDDLAHSLKTPLAVLRGLSEQHGISKEATERVDEQVGRMDQILDYQLRKAATVGRQAFTQPLAPRQLVDKVVRALSKVYREKEIQYDVELEEQIRLRGDEGDLMEVIGNLVDNASKWCDKKVSIQGFQKDRSFWLSVEDDGPGFPPEKSAEVLRRGVRADSRNDGQGIGLAVVHDVINVYGGSLELLRSPLGGARVNVSFPSA